MAVNRKHAGLKVIIGVLGVSFSAILVRFSDAPPMALVFYRIGFAALLMTVPGIRAFQREAGEIRRRDIIYSIISGFFLALHFAAYFTAVKETSIASAVVLVDAEVFFVAFIQRVFFKEKLSALSILGIVITFAGSVIIALGDASGTRGSLRGDLIALAGALCMGIYTVLGRQCRKDMSTGAYTTIVYWTAALTALLWLVIGKTPVVGYSWKDLGCAFGMTILCTLLGHSVFSWGLKYLPAAFVSTAKLLEPVFASLLGILFFRELPGLPAIAGGLVVIAGIWLTVRYMERGEGT